MDVNIVKEEYICVVYISGELTQATMLPFEKSLKALFTELSIADSLYPLPVLIDLASVSYIDSAGVATLVGAYLDSRHWLIELGFSGFQQRTLQVILRTKVDQMLTIYTDEQKGRRALIEHQRLYQRCPYEADAWLKSEEQPYRVRCINISKGGCSVLSATSFPPGTTGLELLIPEAEIEALVDVRRSQAKEGKYEVAVAFEKVDIFLNQKIVELILSLQPV